jgi:MSHA pilin protein MshD
VSLFEVILAVVVVGIVVSALAITFTTTVLHSADPMIRRQAQLIAEAYLEEILLKRFYDPNTNNVCPAPEGSRNLYDNVCDYNNINGDGGAAGEAPRDQFGNAIGALSAYNVVVAVTSAGATLGTLNNASVTKVLRVDVTVTGPNNTSIALSGYRTNYNCDALGDPGCKP